MALDVRSASQHVTTQEGVTCIDLTEVDFVLPGGIVAVACMARDASERGDQIKLLAPTDSQVARYASRMGLGDVLEMCDVENTLPAVKHRSRGDVLLECGWAEDSSIGELAGLVSERLWEAGIDAQITDVLTTSVYEIADNVKVHAGAGGGFVCAQTYRRGTLGERIEVAIGDIGCGVRASLAARYSPADDEEALRLATTVSVTRLPEERRGLGLHYAARDIPRAGGRLTLRSGEALLGVNPDRRYSTRCASIPGTLVAIGVPVGGLRKG